MDLFVDTETKFTDVVKSPIAFHKSGAYYKDNVVGRVRMRKGMNHITCQFYKGREHVLTTRLNNPYITAPSKMEFGNLCVWATTLRDKDDGFHIYSKTRAEAREVNRKLRETFSL